MSTARQNATTSRSGSSCHSGMFLRAIAARRRQFGRSWVSSSRTVRRLERVGASSLEGVRAGGSSADGDQLNGLVE